MNVGSEMQELAAKAKQASYKMNSADAQAKRTMLMTLAALLQEKASEIDCANAQDLEAAKARNLDAPRLDRLTIRPAVLEDMIAACKHVADLPDPIGTLETQWQRPNGIRVGRMRVPLGVIAMIYESRPNVTIDAAILCLKAGNAVILRGGSEAIHSNQKLAELLRLALRHSGLPEDAVQFVNNTDHACVRELCRLDQYIDVMIPRGGENLVRTVTEQATMPVLKHFKGVCHAYIDAGCDLSSALEIVYNGKVQRPGVCNALECLLVHKDVCNDFLPMVAERLSGVEFRACPASLPLLGERARAQKAEDLGCEFHDYILAVSVVESFEQALAHIARYGSQHTEIICTRDLEHAHRFVREVDASMVGVNVSTRFNDGGQLGLGAEIGISTSKLHAYGPMGVRELTTTKFVVLGEGQVRQ